MNARKNWIIVSFCLLTACASHKAAVEQQLNALPSPGEQTSTTSKTLDQSTTTKSTTTETKTTKLQNQAKGKASTISSWEIRGAMAAKNKAKGWSATLNWTQSGPNNYQIRLIGPIGAGSVLIKKEGGTVSFQDGKKRNTSSNADELLQKQTGIRLPVSNLYYWVRGLPAPGGVQSEHRDPANNLVSIRQNGYTITFAQYTSVNGINLPKMVRLDGNGVMVKVIINNWRI
jgi:outer membrane lipoprotein LolB